MILIKCVNQLLIADNIDDSNAKNDWDRKPKYNLITAFNNYIIPQLGE